MEFEIIMKVAKRDALALYEYYFNARGERVDVVENTSYELLAVGLNARGCKTSRGADFTAAVVRACVAELERAGAALRVESVPGKFDLVLPEYFLRQENESDESDDRDSDQDSPSDPGRAAGAVPRTFQIENQFENVGGNTIDANREDAVRTSVLPERSPSFSESEPTGAALAHARARVLHILGRVETAAAPRARTRARATPTIKSGVFQRPSRTHARA